MLADYGKVVDMLKKSMTADVSAVELQLKKLAIDDINFLACLEGVLKDITEEKQVKIIATSYINALFVENSSDYSSEFSYGFMSKLLVDPNIPLYYKKQFSRALIHILERSSENTVAQYVNLALKAISQQHHFIRVMGTSPSSQREQSWQLLHVGHLIISSICCAEMPQQLTYLCFHAFKPSFIVVKDWMQSIMNDPLCVSKFLEAIYLLECWQIVVDSFQHVQYSSADTKKCLECFMGCEQFCEVLNLIYFYAGSSSMQSFSAFNLVATNTELFSVEQLMQINELKSLAFCLNQKILAASLQLGAEQKDSHSNPELIKIVYTKLIDFTGTISEHLIKSLYINSKPVNKKLIFQIQCDDCLCSMLILLRTLFHICPYVLRETWKGVLHSIVFPLLETSDQEIEDFEANSVGFVEIAEDCCEGQKLGTLKSEVARFLEQMGDDWRLITKQEHNIINYTIEFAVYSIKHQMQLLTMDTTTASYPFFPPISLENSFMVLTIFSYCLEKNSLPMQDLRVVLCDRRVCLLPPLERARILMFLSYNFKDVFGKPEDAPHLIEMALLKSQNDSVTHCSIDFLNSILQMVYSDQMALNLARRILEGGNPVNFWPMMKKMLELHYIKMSQDVFLVLVDQCFGRLRREISRVSKQEIRMTHEILNILSVLRNVCDKMRTINHRNLNKLKKMALQRTPQDPQAKPITTYDRLKQQIGNNIFQIVNPSFQYHFSEDLYKALNTFLLSCNESDFKTVPELQELLSLTLNKHKEQQYMNTDYCITFNAYVMKGSWQEHGCYVYMGVKEGFKVLVGDLSEKAYKGEQKIAISNHLVVLQNLLGRFGNELGSVEILELKDLSSALFPEREPSPEYNYNNSNHQTTTQITKARKIFDKILLTRTLNLHLLCHQYVCDEQMVSKLMQFQDLNIYELSSDITVLHSCLKTQIFKESSIVNITEMINFFTMVLWAQKEKADRDKKGGGEKKKKNKDDLLKIKISRKINYEYIYSHITTPFHAVSYEPMTSRFKDLCHSLRNTNEPLFASIYTSMAASIRDKLHQLKIILKPESNMMNPMYKETRQVCEEQIQQIPERKIFTVKGMKNVDEQEMAGNDEEQEQGWKKRTIYEQKQFGIDLDEEDSAEMVYQRQRVLMKRKKKQAMQ